MMITTPTFASLVQWQWWQNKLQRFQISYSSCVSAFSTLSQYDIWVCVKTWSKSLADVVNNWLRKLLKALFLSIPVHVDEPMSQVKHCQGNSQPITVDHPLPQHLGREHWDLHSYNHFRHTKHSQFPSFVRYLWDEKKPMEFEPGSPNFQQW